MGRGGGSVRDRIGRLVLLEEGQTHSFLLAESRKAVRRNVPQKRPDVPLVDLPVAPPVPAPPRDGNDGVFHRGKRTTALERKIQIARDEFELNPKWQRQAARMAKSSMDLREYSPRRDLDRPLSRSYQPRFKRDRYNFDTGAARTSVNEFQSSKVLYYQPAGNGTTVPPHRFANSLRNYIYKEDLLPKKKQEKQMHRRWKQEALELGEMAAERMEAEAAAAAAAAAEKIEAADVTSGSGSRIPSASRADWQDSYSDHVRGNNTRYNTPEDGFPYLGQPPSSIEVSPVLQAAMPAELRTLRQRNASVDLERLVAENSGSSLADVSSNYEGIVDATQRHHLATPQIQPTANRHTRGKSAKWKSQHAINVGLTNADLRELHHREGEDDEVDKLLSERFISPRRRRSGAGAPSVTAATQSQGDAGESGSVDEGRVDETSSRSSKLGAAERRNDLLEQAQLEAPEQPSSDVEEADNPSQVKATDEGKQMRGMSATGRRRPKPKKDASIFNKILHHTIGADEIPNSSPAWLSYAVYDSEPEEEEENELAKALRAIREREVEAAAQDDNEQQTSLIPQPVDALSGTTPAPTAGVFGRRGEVLRTPPPAVNCADTGRQRHRWKKGAVTLRGLELPSELANRFEDGEQWPARVEGHEVDPLLLLQRKATTSLGEEGSEESEEFQRPETQRMATSRHHGLQRPGGGRDQGKRRQLERDLHLTSLILRSAEGALNPIQVANRSRR